MNHLKQIIRGIENSTDSFKSAGIDNPTANISSLLAHVEQVIYDRLSLDREISDVDGAKKLLTRLHSEEPGSFEEYMNSLHNLKSEDKFSIALEVLMSEVAKSDNPGEILLALLEEERGSGLVTEQNILPALFFVEDETEEMRAFRKMVAANPDLKATLITRKLAQLGQKATWVAPKPEYQGSGFKPSEPIWNAADTQQVWDEAFSEWKNMSPAEQRTATRAATRAVQNEAELAIQMRGRAIMDEPVGPAARPVEPWLPPKDTIVPGEIELTTWPLMGGPETGWNLSTWDYQRIREYFAGEKTFSNMSGKQQSIVESLRYTPEQFEAKFAPTGDTAMFHELNAQLKSELLADGLVSKAEMDAFVGIEERFAVSAEEFGPHFAISKGTEVSMNLDPWAIPDINTEVPPQLVADRGLEEYTLAKDQFQEEPRVPVEAAPEPPQSAPPVKRYRTEAEVRADISDLTDDYEPWRPDDVERMQVLMDELEEIHFTPDRGLEDFTFRDPFPDLDAPAFRDWDYSGDSQELLGGDRETAWGLSDEDASLLGRIKGPQASTALSEEQLGILLDGMKEAYGEGGTEVRANIAFSQSGEILIEESFLKKFAKHQVKNLAMAPVVMALINLISQGDQAVSNYIAVGLGVFDVFKSGALGVFGLAASVLGVMLGEFNIKAQAKLDNETPDKYRGRHFGFIKINSEWRPAVVKEIHKSTDFNSRNAELMMEYGDDLIWVQSGTGEIKPFFTNPHSKTYDITEDEMVGDRSTKSFITNHDMSRDWYFLDKTEREALTQSTRTGADFQFDSYNIKDGMNAYERSLEDVREATEIMQKFKYEAAERRTGAAPEYYADFPSDRGLRDSGQLSVLDSSQWGEWAWQRNQRANASDAMNSWTSDDLAGMFKDKENNEYRFDSPIFPENQFMLDIWHTSLIALVQTQRLAATNAGWDNYFPPGHNEKLVAANPTASYYGPTAQINLEQTPFSAMYTLPEYEYPTALEAGSLRIQLDSIENLDIPRVDRDFLTNKSINRYWINQITSRGGADTLVELTNSQGPTGLGNEAERKKSPQAWLTNDFSEVAPNGMLGEEQFDSGQSAGFKRYMGMRMPWTNSNDIGMFPEDLGYLELTPENEAKDFQYEGYSKEILHRFDVTKESVDNTGERPDYSAMEYNPENYYSTMYLPGQEPRFSSLKPSGPTLFLPEAHTLFPSKFLYPPASLGKTYRHPEHQSIWRNSASTTVTEFSKRIYELYTEYIPSGQTEPIGKWNRVKSSSRIEGTTLTRIEFEDGSTIEVENEQDISYRVYIPPEEAPGEEEVEVEEEEEVDVGYKKGPVGEKLLQGQQVFINGKWEHVKNTTSDPNTTITRITFNDGRFVEMGNASTVYYRPYQDPFAEGAPVNWDTVEPPPEGWFVDSQALMYVSPDGTRFHPNDEDGIHEYLLPTIDDVLDHFEKHVDIHYDEEGQPTGLKFGGEVFSLDELIPEIEQIEQDTTPDTFDFGEQGGPLERLKQYLEETGVENVTPDMLTPAGTPYVAWSETTKLPVIGGDFELHERLQLPDDVVAVMSSNGVLHQMFNPFLHGITTEGVRHD